MRAAQTIPRKPFIPPLHAALPGRNTPKRRTAVISPWVWGCAGVFLLGYLPGIWIGRTGTTSFGQQLAAYYAALVQSQQASLPTMFLQNFSAAFLQIFAVLLCGFSAWGCGFLLLLFAVRGLFLGFSAASAAAAYGAKGLLLYRLATAIPDIATLLLCLWLAGSAAALAAELFRGMCGRGQHSRTGSLRRLSVRFAASVLLAVLFSGIGLLPIFLAVRLVG